MGDLLAWLTVVGAFLAAGAALWQLRLQRIQLADQTRIQEREQANKIDVAATQIDGAQAEVLPPDKGEPVWMIAVNNNSNRPVREVAAKIALIPAEALRTVFSEAVLADVYGEMMIYGIGQTMREAFKAQARQHSMPVLRAGRAVGFVWGLTVAQYSGFQVWVRFTDDTGLHWEIDTVMHLKKLASRDW